MRQADDGAPSSAGVDGGSRRSAGAGRSGPPTRSGARRPRRHDPDRRERLVRATLDVIAERGVVGVTHRAVAHAADVPLGSTTYHFDSLDDLLAAAFTALADDVADALEERMRAAADTEAALDALAEHMAADLVGRDRGVVLAVELYVLAARRPALRAVTEAWMRRSRRALEQHFDPVTARELDAMVEGLTLHQALSTEPMTPEQIRHALARVAR